ncbi:MAG: GNAT family N-acetyltransferase [Chloroflexota bacterium]
MTYTIKIDDLSDLRVVQFLAEHIADMRSASPPESKHVLDLEGLKKPDVTFWSVWLDDELVACGAIKRLSATHAELKSMRTSAGHRGAGIGTMLVQYIIGAARQRGFRRISLETGAAAFFEPARALYRKNGFEYCPPFDGYRMDPNSVFMTREI